MGNPSSVTLVRYDLAQAAVVDEVISPTQFRSSGLGGFTNGTFALGYSVWVYSKADGSITAPKGESPKAISAFSGSGAISPILPGTVTHAAFTSPLAVGDTVLLLNPAVASAWRSYVLPVPPTIPGTSTLYGSVIKNWQAAEQDLLTIGAAVAGQATVVNFLGVGIQNLVGNIAIRMYCTINGVERRWYPVPAVTTWTALASAPCLAVINGVMSIPGRLRVTVQSDAIADNGAAVTYEAI